MLPSNYLFHTVRPGVDVSADNRDSNRVAEEGSFYFDKTLTAVCFYGHSLVPRSPALCPVLRPVTFPPAFIVRVNNPEANLEIALG